LRFGEENVYFRVCCSSASNSDFDNPSTRGGIMEMIEIVFCVLTVIGGAYIIWDALYV
jgi:hypothetical protein